MAGCGPYNPLRDSEKKVIQDFRNGLSDRQVAKKHKIEQKTAHNLRTSICEKLTISLEQLCPHMRRLDFRKTGPQPKKELNKREKIAREMFSEGASARQVAVKISTSVEVAYRVRSNICRKLRLSLEQLCPKEKRKDVRKRGPQPRVSQLTTIQKSETTAS